MELTPFDERVVRHTVQTLITRWPFVPANRRNDYRRTYRPADLFDTLAFAVSGGATWEVAKLRLASEYERQGRHDLAAAEYRGLARDAPLFEEPLRLLGRALLANADTAEAEGCTAGGLGSSHPPRTRPTPSRRSRSGGATSHGASLTEAIVDASAESTRALNKLSLAYALVGDVENARWTALRLRQLSPGFPGLAAWLQSLGVGS